MCSEEQEPPKQVKLFTDDLTELSKQQDLIESQERILSALRLQMEKYIVDHYGVDLEDNWILDLVAGTLVRTDM